MALLLDHIDYEKFLPKNRRVLKYMEDIEAMKAAGHSMETIAMAISKAIGVEVSVSYLKTICSDYKKSKKASMQESSATA